RRVAAQQRARHRDTRIQVSPRAATGDDHAPCACRRRRWHVVHTSTEACCETLSRMPNPTRLTIIDEPPELTKGSGNPLVGSRPSTTLMLMSAWTAIIAVTPTA